MKLYLEGITRNTDNPVVIAELKKCGYKEVVIEPVDDKPVEKKAAKAAKEGE